MSIPKFKVGDKVQYGVVTYCKHDNKNVTEIIWCPPSWNRGYEHSYEIPSWHINRYLDPFQDYEFKWQTALVTSVSPMKIVTTDEGQDSVRWPGPDNIYSTEELWNQKWFLRLAR